jgi:hypothetical protein
MLRLREVLRVSGLGDGTVGVGLGVLAVILGFEGA